ncbi:MAG TPA: sulfotransferase [Acetobacteraceae bacterium]|nr:sulfotransferase [Acetobacteraceae bacterium]
MDDADLRRTVNVDVFVNGIQYATPRADILREDLQREFGYGHHAFTFDFNPPLSLIRDHHVQLQFANTGQPIPNGERVLQAIALDGARLLQPILVTAPGRAGSTILMKRLAGHSSVSVAALYPFETELLKYYGHAFGILTAPGDHERSGSPEGFVTNQRFLGANPYNVPGFAEAFRDPGRFAAIYRSVAPRELAGAFRSVVNGFYASLAEDQDKAGALFFAEKCQLAGMARWFARQMFPATREIALVRDVRDTICSYKSFWSHSTAEAIRLLKLSCDALMAIRKEQRPDTMFVRYEDMVGEEAATLQRIAAFIGIRDFVAADAGAEQALFQEHGTSKSPAASVGRWKREMSAEEVKNCSGEFAAYLELFGYEV